MKKILILLAIAFIVISACMIYLVKSGVSLRSAPIIRPSVIAEDRHNIAHGLVYRLSPEFQNAHYVLWGVLPQNEDTQKVLALTKSEYEKVFPQKVTILEGSETLSQEQLKACAKPCWVLLPREKAHELSANEFIEKTLRPLGQEYFSLTWMPFTKAVDVAEYCLQEKRLTLECLYSLAIQEAQRKMKPGSAYFFMKKYKDRDFFLFFQESPQL